MKLLLPISVAAVVVLGAAAKRLQPHPPLVEQAIQLTDAIERGDYATVRKHLPDNEASKFGMTEQQMRSVVMGYIVPAFANAKWVGGRYYSHSSAAGSGSCTRRILTRAGKPETCTVLIGFTEVSPGSFGYKASLVKLINASALLRSSQLGGGTPMMRLRADRGLLEGLGMVGWPRGSSVADWGEFAAWLDKTIKEEADRASSVNAL